MKMKGKPLVLTLASLTVGIGLGLLISALLFPPNDASVKSSPHEAIGLPSSSVDTANLEPDSVPIDFVELVQLENVTEQRIAFYQMLENKSGEQIADLLELTFAFESAESLYSGQQILFAELARVEPDKALELVWETERSRWGALLDVVAIHWGLVASKDALQAFASLTEPWKSTAIKTVFQHQGSLNETELAELASSLDITDHLVRWTYEVELAAVLNEPQTAFEFTLSADISDFQKRRNLKQITSRWIEREGTDDIVSKLSLVYDVFTDTRSLWIPVVSEIAKSNPAVVWEQLTSMSPDVQQRFCGSVFEVWVASDPDAALQVIIDKEYMTYMEFYHSRFLATWVRAVSDRFLEHIDLLPEADKILAINRVVNHLAHSSPPNEMLELLSQLRSRGFSTLEPTESFVEIWNRKDPLAAVEWTVKNLDQGPSNGRWMLTSALEQLALLDPDKAMEIALKQPAQDTFEHVVVDKLLRQGEFEKALSLAPQVRDSPIYSSIYARAGYFLIGAGRIEDALAITEKVEELKRPEVYRSLVFTWLYNDPDSLLEYLPNLATPQIRAIVATEALRIQEYSSFLTEKEAEFVHTFTPDETN